MFKKSREKKKITFEEPIFEQTIIEEPIVEEPKEEQLPETFEVDDNYLSELNNIHFWKEEEEDKQKDLNF